jgi:hypothetical protein
MGYAGSSKVILAVTDVAVSSSKIDAADTELALLLGGTREIGLTYFGVGDSDWSYNFTNVRWDSGGGAGGSLIFPIPYDYGKKITEAHLTIEVVTTGAGGDLKLMRRTRTPVAGSMAAVETVATIDADIWNGLTNNYATEMSYTGLSYTMAVNYNYWWRLTARTGVVCKVHEAMMKSDDGS